MRAYVLRTRRSLEPEDGWHMCKYLKRPDRADFSCASFETTRLSKRKCRVWKSNATGGRFEFRRMPRTKVSKQRKGSNKVANWTLRVEFMRAFQKFHIRKGPPEGSEGTTLETPNSFRIFSISYNRNYRDAKSDHSLQTNKVQIR